MRPEDSREINLLHNLLAIVALKRAVHGCLFSAKVGFGLSIFLGRLSWCVLIIFSLSPVCSFFSQDESVARSCGFKSSAFPPACSWMYTASRKA